MPSIKVFNYEVFFTYNLVTEEHINVLGSSLLLALLLFS